MPPERLPICDEIAVHEKGFEKTETGGEIDVVCLGYRASRCFINLARFEIVEKKDLCVHVYCPSSGANRF